MRFSLDDISAESTPLPNSTFVAHAVAYESEPIGSVIISAPALSLEPDAVRPFIVERLNAMLDAGTPEEQLRAGLSYVLRVA